MDKDLKGKELGVGLYQRKDGRYEAKATIRKNKKRSKRSLPLYWRT